MELNDKNLNEIFMKEALKEAKKAFKKNETPIGAVIVKDNKIISRAHNKRNSKHNTICHAEIIAIDKACHKLKDWRLEGCTMYVTLEPCPMCAGALIQSRIDKVVIGALSPKSGCAGSVINLFETSGFNHTVIVEKDILKLDCESLMTQFFDKLRKSKKSDN